ncbi:MAG: hypothetical protein IKB67_00575 [Clostridia bacterium]|nr:hypothetical protein [Clostridia bacterium]
MKEKGNKNILNVMSYIAFVIIALLILMNNLLPLIDVTIGPKIKNVLETVQNLLVLIVLGVLSYKFTLSSAKWIKVLYWIALIIFIAGTVILWA